MKVHGFFSLFFWWLVPQMEGVLLATGRRQLNAYSHETARAPSLGPDVAGHELDFLASPPGVEPSVLEEGACHLGGQARMQIKNKNDRSPGLILGVLSSPPAGERGVYICNRW